MLFHEGLGHGTQRATLSGKPEFTGHALNQGPQIVRKGQLKKKVVKTSSATIVDKTLLGKVEGINGLTLKVSPSKLAKARKKMWELKSSGKAKPGDETMSRLESDTNYFKYGKSGKENREPMAFLAELVQDLVDRKIVKVDKGHNLGTVTTEMITQLRKTNPGNLRILSISNATKS